MRNSASFIIFLLAGMIWLIPGSVAAGNISSDLAARLTRMRSDEMVDVLVYFTDQLDAKRLFQQKKEVLTAGEKRIRINKALRSKAAQAQANVKQLLLQNKVRNIRSFWIVNGLAATVPVAAIQQIASRPGVARVALDGKVKLPETTIASAAANVAWNIDLTLAPQLWQQGYDGSGIVIAIVDTGVDMEHQDLQARWRGGNNSWYDPNGEHPTPYDPDGHGTRVAGILVGGDASGSAIGMAPGARWIAVKIFDDAGNASYSDIHLGFQWLLDPDNNPLTDDAPQLVNNSWGLNALVGQCVTEFQPDIQLLQASGIAVNFSAGNGGPNAGTSISPANYPESFAVGGIDVALLVTDFSSRGPSACGGALYPALVAPAVDIRTADLTFGGLFPDSYATVSGTSFAVPHITGAMALLKNARPWITAADLRQVLTLSADDLEAPGPDNDSGYGLVNVVQALNLLDSHTCTDANGQPYFNSEGCKGGGGQPGFKAIAPILHLLLGRTISNWHGDGIFLSLVPGNPSSPRLTPTHEVSYESTI